MRTVPRQGEQSKRIPDVVYVGADGQIVLCFVEHRSGLD